MKSMNHSPEHARGCVVHLHYFIIFSSPVLPPLPPPLVSRLCCQFHMAPSNSQRVHHFITSSLHHVGCGCVPCSCRHETHKSRTHDHKNHQPTPIVHRHTGTTHCPSGPAYPIHESINPSSPRRNITRDCTVFIIQ